MGCLCSLDTVRPSRYKRDLRMQIVGYWFNEINVKEKCGPHWGGIEEKMFRLM